MFSKSYIIPPLELTLDYIVLNYFLLDTFCFSYAVNVSCLVVKYLVIILFRLKPKFCNFLADQNFFLNKMPKTCEITLELRHKIITLKKDVSSSREI